MRYEPKPRPDSPGSFDSDWDWLDYEERQFAPDIDDEEKDRRAVENAVRSGRKIPDGFDG
jgi:hypothetical protein